MADYSKQAVATRIVRDHAPIDSARIAAKMLDDFGIRTRQRTVEAFMAGYLASMGWAEKDRKGNWQLTVRGTKK